MTLKEICDSVWDPTNPVHVQLKYDWFNTEHPLLGGEIPINIMHTSKGARRIKQILNAAIYGVFL
jgi:hypothetical protein